MARSPKKQNGNGADDGDNETEVVSTTLVMPPPKVVQDIARAKRKAKKETGEINGKVGKMVAAAVESKHLDRKAHAIACQLDAMDDERLGPTYFHLLRYLDDLGVTERATAQNEMFEARVTGPGLKDKGADKDDGKVTPIGVAARRVSERAGESP